MVSSLLHSSQKAVKNNTFYNPPGREGLSPRGHIAIVTGSLSWRQVHDSFLLKKKQSTTHLLLAKCWQRLCDIFSVWVPLWPSHCITVHNHILTLFLKGNNSSRKYALPHSQWPIAWCFLYYPGSWWTGGSNQYHSDSKNTPSGVSCTKYAPTHNCQACQKCIFSIRSISAFIEGGLLT